MSRGLPKCFKTLSHFRASVMSLDGISDLILRSCGHRPTYDMHELTDYWVIKWCCECLTLHSVDQWHDWWVINWKVYAINRNCLDLKVLPRHFSEVTETNHEISHRSQCLGWDLHPISPKRTSEMSLLGPTCSRGDRWSNGEWRRVWEKIFVSCLKESTKLLGIFLDKVRENKIRPEITDGSRF